MRHAIILKKKVLKVSGIDMDPSATRDRPLPNSFSVSIRYKNIHLQNAEWSADCGFKLSVLYSVFHIPKSEIKSILRPLDFDNSPPP
jgi:hypothetical protein